MNLPSMGNFLQLLLGQQESEKQRKGYVNISAETIKQIEGVVNQIKEEFKKEGASEEILNEIDGFMEDIKSWNSKEHRNIGELHDMLEARVDRINALAKEEGRDVELADFLYLIAKALQRDYKIAVSASVQENASSENSIFSVLNQIRDDLDMVPFNSVDDSVKYLVARDLSIAVNNTIDQTGSYLHFLGHDTHNKTTVSPTGSVLIGDFSESEVNNASTKTIGAIVDGKFVSFNDLTEKEIDDVMNKATFIVSVTNVKGGQGWIVDLHATENFDLLEDKDVQEMEATKSVAIIFSALKTEPNLAIKGVRVKNIKNGIVANNIAAHIERVRKKIIDPETINTDIMKTTAVFENALSIPVLYRHMAKDKKIKKTLKEYIDKRRTDLEVLTGTADPSHLQTYMYMQTEKYLHNNKDIQPDIKLGIRDVNELINIAAELIYQEKIEMAGGDPTKLTKEELFNLRKEAEKEAIDIFEEIVINGTDPAKYPHTSVIGLFVSKMYADPKFFAEVLAVMDRTRNLTPERRNQVIKNKLGSIIARIEKEAGIDDETLQERFIERLENDPLLMEKYFDEKLAMAQTDQDVKNILTERKKWYEERLGVDIDIKLRKNEKGEWELFNPKNGLHGKKLSDLVTESYAINYLKKGVHLQDNISQKIRDYIKPKKFDLANILSRAMDNKGVTDTTLRVKTDAMKEVILSDTIKLVEDMKSRTGQLDTFIGLGAQAMNEIEDILQDKSLSLDKKLSKINSVANRTTLLKVGGVMMAGVGLSAKIMMGASGALKEDPAKFVALTTIAVSIIALSAIVSLFVYFNIRSKKNKILNAMKDEIARADKVVDRNVSKRAEKFEMSQKSVKDEKQAKSQYRKGKIHTIAKKHQIDHIEQDVTVQHLEGNNFNVDVGAIKFSDGSTGIIIKGVIETPEGEKEAITVKLEKQQNGKLVLKRPPKVMLLDGENHAAIDIKDTKELKEFVSLLKKLGVIGEIENKVIPSVGKEVSAGRKSLFFDDLYNQQASRFFAEILSEVSKITSSEEIEIK